LIQTQAGQNTTVSSDLAWPRNVVDEVRNSTVGYILQVRADCIDVNALHELGARLKDRPSLHHESF
jgi:hypothetical protein